MLRPALRALALAVAVAALAFVAGLFGLAAAEVAGTTAASPPSGPSEADVPMDLQFVKPVVEMRINGHGPYKIVIDSGSEPNLILDEEVAAELELAAEGTQRIGDPLKPDAIQTDVHTVRTVEVGDLRVENVRALSWDRKLYTGEGAPRGVAGLGLFDPRLVTFDYPQKRFRVTSGSLPEPDGRTVFAAMWRHGPSIDIEVGGQTFKAHLDTGSDGFIGLPRAAKNFLTFSSEPREVGRAQTVNTSVAIKEGTLKGAVRVGAISIDNPPIGLSYLPGASLGSEFLKSTVVTFDRANERVRLTAEGPIAVPSRGARFGLHLAPPTGPGPLVVDGVEAGSGAEASGLRAGDVIVKANGKSIAEMGPGDLGMLFRSAAFTLVVQRDGKEVEIPVKRNLPPS